MTDTFSQVILAAMGAAMAALWARIGTMQSKIETLIKDEAICRAKLDALERTLETKHQENQAAIASLYCKQEPK